MQLRESLVLYPDHTGCGLGTRLERVCNSVAPLFNPMQGGFQFYVAKTSNDDHVDDIYVHKTLASSSSFTDPTYYSGDYGYAMLELSFRVQCDHNFYGRNCSTFCVHTDNSTGHYACGTNGERVCLNGWRNPSGTCKQILLYIK